MKRVLTSLLLTSAIGCVLGACSDESYVSGGSGGWRTPCSGYMNCETCTPVFGCGWCTAPNGSGVCSPDPDDCPTEEFSWTWNPSGCQIAADASVVFADSPIEAFDAGVAAEDASAPTEDVAPSGDAKIESAVDGGDADVAQNGCVRGGDASDGAATCD
jgi:hypothetical protein